MELGMGKVNHQTSGSRALSPLTFSWSVGCEVSWSRLTSHALWGVLGLLDFPCLVRELDGGGYGVSEEVHFLLFLPLK